jgi:hypothetical protein
MCCSDRFSWEEWDQEDLLCLYWLGCVLEREWGIGGSGVSYQLVCGEGRTRAPNVQSPCLLPLSDLPRAYYQRPGSNDRILFNATAFPTKC